MHRGNGTRRKKEEITYKEVWGSSGDPGGVAYLHPSLLLLLATILPFHRKSGAVHEGADVSLTNETRTHIRTHGKAIPHSRAAVPSRKPKEDALVRCDPTAFLFRAKVKPERKTRVNEGQLRRGMCEHCAR